MAVLKLNVVTHALGSVPTRGNSIRVEAKRSGITICMAGAWMPLPCFIFVMEQVQKYNPKENFRCPPNMAVFGREGERGKSNAVLLGRTVV